MIKLKLDDTIKIGVYSGITVRECIKQYGKKSLLEVLRYYDLDDEFSKRYYYKKEEVQTNEKQDEDTPHLWEGTDRNYQEFFEAYDEMQSSYCYDGVDDEYWYSLYLEGKNHVSWTSGVGYEPDVCNYEPEENSEKLMLREMHNKGYKYWIYG